MKTDRFRRTVLDHEVESLQGYCGLGMQRQCLATAKRLLRRPQVTAHAFAEAVDAILIQGSNLRHWQPWIEVAYERLSDPDRKKVRFQMLAFYVSREEWKSAENHVPQRSDNPIELLFAMWTLLELRRDSSAQRIYRQCQKAWRAGSGRWVEPRDEEEEMIISALIEAIASYHAQMGHWDVVVISAGIRSNLDRALALGAFACVPKPFTVEAVMTPVRAALRAESRL